MTRTIRRLLFNAVFFSVSLFPQWGFAYNNLVIFGDSLADAGNNATVFSAIEAANNWPAGTLTTPTPISGPTFIPDYAYSSGRYSNGPVWTEYFGASLGLASQASASLLGGNNFAYAGARSGPSGTLPYSRPLVDQVNTYLGGISGPASAGTLYVVEGGGNDARDAAVAADPTSIVTNYVTNMVTIIGELKAAGARNILLWNIPDLGKTPAIQAYGSAAAGQVSGLVNFMNGALSSTLAGMPASFTDGLTQFDAFGLMDSIFANPADYGLSNVTAACAASQGCIDAPSGTLFWDGIHPTTAGHAIFAQLAYAAVVPEPETVVSFGLGLLVIMLRQRRSS